MGHSLTRHSFATLRSLVRYAPHCSLRSLVRSHARRTVEYIFFGPIPKDVVKCESLCARQVEIRCMRRKENHIETFYPMLSGKQLGEKVDVQDCPDTDYGNNTHGHRWIVGVKIAYGPTFIGIVQIIPICQVPIIYQFNHLSTNKISCHSMKSPRSIHRQKPPFP